MKMCESRITGAFKTKGNGSFWPYSRSDPGSFRSNSLSVRLFRPDFRGGSFLPNFGRSFWPTLFNIVFSCVKSFSGFLDLFNTVSIDNKRVFSDLI